MKKVSPLVMIVLIITSFSGNANSPYKVTVETLWEEYASTKNLDTAHTALLRCAALISLTNLLVNNSQVDEALPNPEVLLEGAGNIIMKTSNTTAENVSKTLLDGFREHSKYYQKWLSDVSKTNNNPLSDPQFKAEFELCNEAAIAFEQGE